MFYSIGGVFQVDMVEKMECVWLEEKDWDELKKPRRSPAWWALTGNRRLYLYQELERLGVISDIQVKEVSLHDKQVKRAFIDRLSTRCDGVAIVCRQPQLKNKIRRIFEEWRNEMRKRGNLERENVSKDKGGQEFTHFMTQVSVEEYDAGIQYDDFIPKSSKTRKA
jgi:hypothetical protein